jgi:excisionase family DNA binding protein
MNVDMTGEFMKQRYLRPSRVAELLDHKERTIRAWIASGRLPSVHFGVSVRVPVEAVEKLIEDAERARQFAQAEPPLERFKDSAGSALSRSAFETPPGLAKRPGRLTDAERANGREERGLHRG